MSPDANTATPPALQDAAEPQSQQYVKPCRRNGWLVRAYTTIDQRTEQLRKSTCSYRNYTPTRVVRRSIVGPRFDVTLPYVKFLGISR
jgi:hypothetical protein